MEGLSRVVITKQGAKRKGGLKKFSVDALGGAARFAQKKKSDSPHNNGGRRRCARGKEKTASPTPPTTRTS